MWFITVITENELRGIFYQKKLLQVDIEHSYCLYGTKNTKVKVSYPCNPKNILYISLKKSKIFTNEK